MVLITQTRPSDFSNINSHIVSHQKHAMLKPHGQYELSHREKVLREIYSHEKFWFDMKSNLQIGKKIFLEVGYVF